MVQRKVLYVILWHVGFMLVYLLGALALSGAKDFTHLNIHLLNVCALFTIVMVLSYQFMFVASFYRRFQHYQRSLLINFVVILALYLLYACFYIWLFIDYLQNREEHLYFGLRDMHHLFEVKENMLHVGFFALMIYSSFIYFINFYLLFIKIKRISSSMSRKAYYKVYYNPIIFSLIVSSILFVVGFFILHAQDMVL